MKKTKIKNSFKHLPFDKLPVPKITSYVNNDFKEKSNREKGNKDNLKTVDNIFTKEFINEYFD